MYTQFSLFLIMDRCLQICLLAGIFCSPKISTHGFYNHLWTAVVHVQSGKKFELPDTFLPSQPRSNRVTMTSCFTSHIVNKCPFHGLCHVFHIRAFSGDLVFKIAPKYSAAKCYLEFLRSRRP